MFSPHQTMSLNVAFFDCDNLSVPVEKFAYNTDPLQANAITIETFETIRIEFRFESI